MRLALLWIVKLAVAIAFGLAGFIAAIMLWITLTEPAPSLAGMTHDKARALLGPEDDSIGPVHSMNWWHEVRIGGWRPVARMVYALPGPGWEGDAGEEGIINESWSAWFLPAGVHINFIATPGEHFGLFCNTQALGGRPISCWLDP